MSHDRNIVPQAKEYEMGEKLEYVKECQINTLNDVKGKASKVIKRKQEIDNKLESLQLSVTCIES